MRIALTHIARNNVSGVAERFWQFSGFFAIPVRLVITSVFLYRYVQRQKTLADFQLFSSILGWSTLAGVAVILLTSIVNYPMAKYDLWVRCTLFLLTMTHWMYIIYIVVKVVL